MKKTVLSLLICAAALPALAQQTPAVHRLTLEQCLEYAMGNNYGKQSLVLSEEAAADVYRQSKMERLPGLDASASEGFSNSKAMGSSWDGSYGVNTGVTLYQGGTVKNTIDKNRLTSEQSGYVTSQYDNTLTVNILQSFLAILGNEELLKYQQVVAGASKEQVNQGREQLRAGTILESDYLLLEAQYANDMNNVSDTEIARTNSLLSLKSLLSMPLDTEIDLIYPDTASLMAMARMPELYEVLNRASSTMPDLKISQYNVDIAGSNVKLAKAGYYPSVSLSAGIGTGHNDGFSNYGSQLSDSFNQQAGLKLSVPLFNNGRTKSKVTQSRIALQQAELDMKQAHMDVEESVSVEYNDVVSSFNKYKTTDIRQNAYLKTFEAYRVQFNAGAITAVDLLQQQNNYISALNDYIQSKYGFMLKRKVLDVYMGVPITM